MTKYIYQYDNWTDFSWENAVVSAALGEVRLLQGKILGQIHSLGFESKNERNLEMLTFSIVKSSEIEGEMLNYQQVRSSIARRLGMNTAGLVPSPRNVDGIVEMMLDATYNYKKPLTKERLFGWHAALFPTGYSTFYAITVAQYRKDEVQVVSGAIGKEKVHYEAVPAKDVNAEMDKFLLWLNDDNIVIDAIIKAAIAHFWFIIIHPFDDGNGRIARTISDMMLARSENNSERFYSLSKQIQHERSGYYEILKRSQYGSDITEWLVWFLNCLKHALQETEASIQSVLHKAEFWEKHRNTQINERQRMMINKLFDGFDGKLTSSKWAKITKTSSDTALRDIQDLIAKGILKREEAGGRSVNYTLNNDYEKKNAGRLDRPK
ncbi:Fic/DOC family protein [Candidatus Methanoplasma termitum]|uniref:Fic/DOC family protein n=1 Tax=Candidatus Methanoplasma termitum TaxID=1577791 RepID=A0A0A7LEM0_9ARCH|nr:Fic family protein [Candidatus Methanoplasma termitum]AIZ55976.1 Fic/DOC family protein [Candidatus Methanoplasma termitum]MCL2334412.1 Fic family protein [Candidatus Methanoplasma sp.]